jgi:hypothetical protein
MSVGRFERMSAACPLFGLVLRLQPRADRDLATLLAGLQRELLAPRCLLLAEGESAGDYIITGDGVQATDADRRAIVAWLDRRPLAGTYTVSELGDVGRSA